MTLDEQVLEQTKEIREKLLETERELEHLRTDYHHSIRLLHARGGNMREIAEALVLSHQRVHQIVGADAGPPPGPDGPRGRGPGRGGHGGPPHERGGRGRHFRGGIFGRFTEEAQEVVRRASGDARELAHPAVESPHLLLALAELDPRVAAAVDPEELRPRVAAAYPQASEPRRGRMRFGHTAKHTLARAFHDATERGGDRVDARALALGLTHEGAQRDELDPLGIDLDRLANAFPDDAE